MTAMTAKEKWGRLTNPETVEDYGLLIKEDELLEFNEGRELIAALRKATDKRMELVVKMIANNTRQTVERVSYGELTVYPLGPNV